MLSFISEGLPLVYNGQEAGNRRRLAFFERDPITWQDAPQGELLRRLIALKKRNTALWNGADGAVMEPVANSVPKQVFSFVRGNGKDKVVAVFNLSAKPVEVALKGQRHTGRYLDFNDGAEVKLDDGGSLSLPAWGWRVFVR